jgi:hypothetical protein
MNTVAATRTASTAPTSSLSAKRGSHAGVSAPEVFLTEASRTNGRGELGRGGAPLLAPAHPAPPAALQNFDPAYVRFGSIASHMIGTMRWPMSAMSRKRTSFRFIPAASSWQMPPSRPRGLLRSRGLACDPFDAQPPRSKTMVAQPARLPLSRFGRSLCHPR